MNNYLFNNRKVSMAEKIQKVVDSIINGLSIPVRGALSPKGHAALVKVLTSSIYETGYVTKCIMIRAERVGTKGNYAVKGEAFNMLGSNNPYTRALVAYTGEDQVNEACTIKISEYDKENNSIQPKYDVRCGDIDAYSDKRYIEAASIATLDFSMLDRDIKNVFKKTKFKNLKVKKNTMKDTKDKIINSIMTKGISLDDEDNVYFSKSKNQLDNIMTYNIISWSPSNERNETAMFTSVDHTIACDIIDEVGGFALSLATAVQNSIGKLKKFAKRIGQLGTPCIEAGTLGNSEFGVVIYMGEIEGPEDYMPEALEELEKNNIVIDRNTYDGAGYFSVEYMVYMCALLGRKISKAQAALLAIQARCNVVFTKIFGEANSQDVMQHMKDVLIDTVDNKRILKVAAGTDVSKLNKADYDLIIVGNENCLGMIIDGNGGKTLKDVSLQAIVNGGFQNYLLDIAKCSITQTASQMLQKFIYANKEKAMKVLINLIDKQYNNRVNELMNGDVNAKNCSLAQFIFRYVEDGLINEAALESYIKQELTQIKSQIQKFKIEIDAVFLRALFDCSFFLTKGKIDGVLGANENTGRLEAYSYDVELRFQDSIAEIMADDSIVDKDKAVDELLTGVTFKYPSPSADENCIMTFLTKDRLVKRITELEVLSDKEKTILLDYFINTSYGVIKMAPNNTVKHRLAGMDTDYDGVATVFEKELVDILLEKNADNDGVTIKKTVQ